MVHMNDNATNSISGGCGFACSILAGVVVELGKMALTELTADKGGSAWSNTDAMGNFTN